MHRTIKLVVIGAAGVGKTSIRAQFISNRFSTGYRATIGADFISKSIQLDPSQSVVLQIWDTAGQERFSSLSSAFFRGADAALLVFDVNTPDSLQALTRWWDQFKLYAPLREENDIGQFCIVLVGNKVDLGRDKDYPVSFRQAQVAMDNLVPPELYASKDTSPSSSPPVRHRLDSSPLRPSPLTQHSPSDSPHLLIRRLSKSPSQTKSRSKSIDPGSHRSLYASSSVSALSVYHTPSSSVYHQDDSPQSFPELSRSFDSSYPQTVGSIGSSSTGNASAVTLTPRNWDQFRSDEDDLRRNNRSERLRFDSINSVSSSVSAAESFFSAYSSHEALSSHVSEPSGSPLIVRPSLHSHPHPRSPLSSHPPKPDSGPRLFFASAKTGEGVPDVFEYVAKRVVQRWEWEEKHEEEFGHPNGRPRSELELQEGYKGKPRLHQRIPNGGGANGHALPVRERERSWSQSVTLTLNSLNEVVAGRTGNCC
ncbi:hypothetical protein GYMLUDRAFT_34222 [Collybiopsis luxurians FD-317 M1]|nr:hypothetical protein GYMLUDRAFT_34222 [Collybiopsis luxurians FD-317 M1]